MCVLYVAHVRGQKSRSVADKANIKKKLFLTCLMLKM